MIKLLDLILCGTLVLCQLIAIFFIALLFQLIMYKVFHKNPYKAIINLSNKLDKYLIEKIG